MVEFTYTVKDPHGIHARPAGLLVKEVSQFQSDIAVKKGEKYANMKGLFSLMSLSVKSGDTIVVSVSGADEEKAAAKIKDYLENNL